MRLPPGVSGQACSKAQVRQRLDPGRTTADAGHCLALAGLSHCVLPGSGSCTGTSFGPEHFTRVWTLAPTSPGLYSGPKARGREGGASDRSHTVLSKEQGKTAPGAWPAHSRGLSTGIATGQEGWAHQAPSPTMMIVQQSLYINSLFTLNSNTDKRHIHTKEEVQVATLPTLDPRRISNSQVERRVWEGGTGTSTQPTGGRDSSER